MQPVYIGGASALAIVAYGDCMEIYKRGRRGRCRLPQAAPSAKDISRAAEAASYVLNRAALADAQAISDFTRTPLHVYVAKAGRHGACAGAIVHITNQTYTNGMFLEIADGVYLACPELALCQIAARHTRTELALLAGEACATYTMRDMSGRLLASLRCGSVKASNRTAGVQLSSGCTQAQGSANLQNTAGTFAASIAYNTRPLTTRAELLDFCKTHASIKYTGVFRALGEQIVDGAASPMELRVALLLGERTRYGGGGLGIPDMNYKIDATGAAAELSGSGYFKCDMYWPRFNLGVEYQSRQFHSDEVARQSDLARLNALASLGYNIRYATSKQVRNLQAANAFIELLRRDAKLRNRTQIKDLQARRLEFMRELGLIR